MAGHGQVAEAIIHYRKALEIKPDFAPAHYNLGNGPWPGEGGDNRRQSEHFRKALGLASARNDKALADTIRARIKLQQSVRPAGDVSS